MGSFRVSRTFWVALLLSLSGLTACVGPSAEEQAQEAAASEVQRARSDAEVLAQLERLIAEDEARHVALTNLDRKLTEALQVASERFHRLNEQRDRVRDGAGDAAAHDAGVPSQGLEQSWRQARDEVNELLQRRRAVAQQVGIVEGIVEKEKEAVELITMHRVRSPDVSAQAAPQVGTAAPSTPAAALPNLPLLAPLSRVIAPTSTHAAEPTNRFYDPEVSEAERTLQKRATEVALVEHRVRLVEELIALVEDDLNLARIAAKSSDDAADQHQVTALEERLAGLKRARVPVEASLHAAERRAEGARRKLEFLESPFSPQRMQRWFTRAGPRLLVILFVLFVLWMLLRRLARRIAAGMILRGSYASEEERLQRVDTVQRAAKSGFTVSVILIGALALLPEFGVDITVLLGGAAVVSLAIAFGAQSLIKDYFAGITILLENQYRVGNVVRINGTAGVVEDMSLRMTTLRDLHGTAHFVPHGQITNVSNLTHGWSRVVLDIRVAYREDVDRVITVLRELGQQMRTDPDFGYMIVEEPEMLGVDALNPSEVVVRLLIKTRPLKQWPIKREFLRRVKVRFDALDIEHPFPQRKLHFAEPVEAGGSALEPRRAVVTRAVVEDGVETKP